MAGGWKFGKVASPRFVLPRGFYRCRERGWTRGRNQYGRECLKVLFEITAGEHKGLKFEEHCDLRTAKQRGLGQQIDGEWDLFIYVRRGDGGWESNGISRIRPAGDQIERIAAAGLQRAVEGGSSNEGAGGPVAVPDVGELAAFTTGFEAIGTVGGKRQPNEWPLKFAAACTGANLWPPRCPVFLSEFAFTGEFRGHVARTEGSAAGFFGAAYCPLIWFDIDREVEGPDGELVPDINAALVDTRRLVDKLLDLGVPERCLLVFFSGNRGFHIGVFTGLFAACPSVQFAKVTRLVCDAIAEAAGVEIDKSIYKTVQPLRAPNSPHEESGLFKALISLEELRALSAGEVSGIATQPRWFEPPCFDVEPVPRLARIWQAAEAAYAEQQAARGATAGMAGNTDAELFRATMEFLTVGAPDGERATEGFKAGMNLLDFGDIESLVKALLAHGFERSGYPPSEAQQQIAGVLRYWHEQRGGAGA
jgi:hypothetical protein